MCFCILQRSASVNCTTSLLAPEAQVEEEEVEEKNESEEKQQQETTMKNHNNSASNLSSSEKKRRSTIRKNVSTAPLMSMEEEANLNYGSVSQRRKLSPFTVSKSLNKIGDDRIEISDINCSDSKHLVKDFLTKKHIRFIF